MKNKQSFIAFIIVISLSGCFSRWQGDTAKIVISFGSAGRAAYDSLEHKIILTREEETLNFSFKGNTTFEAYVAPGNWNVQVDSYLEGEIYATGSKDVVLKLGQNNETITMDQSLSAKLGWLSANAVDGGDYIFTVDNDGTLAPQNLSYNDKKISITLKGDTQERIIRLSGNGSLFTINSGVTLILDNNITLEGSRSNNASLIIINNGGELIMNAGSGITGNTVKYGGGVYIAGGTFNMYGGEIHHNKVIESGGGVTVAGGKFYMYGGEIHHNEAGDIAGDSGFAGGVDVTGENVLFTMTGGKICNNTAFKGGGGGVAMSTKPTFNMNGGTISGNTAGQGGGVCAYEGTFTMTGGEISKNTATNGSGGGVFMGSTSNKFTKTGGTIHGYSAEDENSNTVKRNTVAVNGYGHAVYVDFYPSKRRETTAGPKDDLNSDKNGSSGVWE